MKTKIIIVIVSYAIALSIGFFFGVDFFRTKEEMNKKKNEKEQPLKDSLMSQNQMQEIYGWKKVVLWSESKDGFEKAYHTRLTWVNYPMEFVKHPDCIDPFGGSSEWRDDKICFYYRFPSGKPEIPNLIAKESRGKTLVIIGSLYADGKRFSGGVYWY